MKNTISTLIRLLPMTAVVLLLMACSDDELVAPQAETPADGIGFGIQTLEQEELLVGGTTRALSAGVTSGQPDRTALDPTVTPLSGSVGGLYVHSLPYPAIGRHNVTAATRAAVSDIASTTDFHDSLTVYGFTDAAYTYRGTSYGPALFGSSGTILTKANNWRSTVRWPHEATTMKFYAYAPSALNELDGFSCSGASYGAAPTIDYTVPSTIGEQRDLLYGVSGEVDAKDFDSDDDIALDNKVVPLTFQHILTAIRFAQGKIPTGFTITGLSLSGVKNEGTYTYGSGWSDVSGSATYDVIHSTTTTETTTDGEGNVTTTTTTTYDHGKGFTPTDYDATTGENVFIDGDSVLFVMPYDYKTKGESVTLTIKLRDSDKKEHTLTANLSTDWKAGYQVIYYITIGEVAGDYVFLVSTSAVEFPFSLSSQNSDDALTVTSYRGYQDYKSVEAGQAVTTHTKTWSVEGYYSDEDCTTSVATPSWLTTLKGTSATDDRTGNGGVNEGTTIAVAAQESTSSIQHSDNFANSWDSQTDLAKHFGKSANCYVINTRINGLRIPLYYGNTYGMSDTEVEQLAAAYGSVDHLGNLIKTGDILTQLNKNCPAETSTAAAETSESDRTYAWQTNATLPDGVTPVDCSGDAPYTASATYVDGKYYMFNDYATNGYYYCYISSKKFSYTTTNISYVYSTPVLLWQDYSGLITLTSSLVDGPSSDKLIEFDVKQQHQGNAVIGLYVKKRTTVNTTTYTTTYSAPSDTEGSKGTETSTSASSDGSDELAWSWHIWVTDEVIDKDVTIGSSGDQVTIMPVNLGWVADNDTYSTYPKREVYVKLKQADSEKTAVVKITVYAGQDLVTGTNTLYQWGRPNALPMVGMADPSSTNTNGLGTTVSRTIYNASNTSRSLTVKEISSVGEAIANPDYAVRLSDYNQWFSTTQDFWASGSTTKSIYDPCPPGYRLPTGDVYSSRLSDANIKADSKGAYFYTNPSGSYGDATVYFPATGYWTVNETDGAALSAGNDWTGTANGHFWTKDSTPKYLQLVPSTSTWSFDDTGNNSELRSIRPVKE